MSNEYNDNNYNASGVSVNVNVNTPKVDTNVNLGIQGSGNVKANTNLKAQGGYDINMKIPSLEVKVLKGKVKSNANADFPDGVDADVNLGIGDSGNNTKQTGFQGNTGAEIIVDTKLKPASPQLSSKKGLVRGGDNVSTPVDYNAQVGINVNQEKAHLQTNSPILNNSPFGMNKEDILHIFDAYQRFQSFDEEIQYIQKHGDVAGVLSSLKTSLEFGIADAHNPAARIEAFGENKFVTEPMPHCCVYVWEGLEDLMVRILIVAAIFQIIIGSIPQIQESENDYVEGLAIVFAVILVVSVGSIVNFTKESKFRELNEKNLAMVTYQVIRAGKLEIIKEEDILVGDIIKLEYGNILPCDGLLLNGSSVKMDEACLTGEPDLVEKESVHNCLIRKEEELEIYRIHKPGKELKGKHVIPSPLIFSGTKAEEGSGWYLAMRIGPNSEGGKIREAINAERSNKKQKKKKESEDADAKDNKMNEKPEEGEKEGEGDGDDDDEEEKKQTPLERKLEELATDISTFGLVAAISTFIALIIRMIYFHVSRSQNSPNEILYERSNWYNTTLLGEAPKIHESYDAIKVLIDFIRILILCIAIIIVAIPEGLPLAVTLSLSVSISKMMDDNNLVRQMSACETMGGAQYICSDKTGTLTKNEMSVDQFFSCGDAPIIFRDVVIDKEKRVDSKIYFKNDGYFEILRQAISLNIDATFNDDDSIKKANKTDIAIIEFLHCLKGSFNDARKEFYPNGDDSMKKRFPFTSSRKKMSTVVDMPNKGGDARIFIKGASEIILSSCTHFLNPLTGEKQLITDENNNNFKGIIKNFAELALRTICLAYKDIDHEENANWKKKDNDQKNVIEKDNFTLLGIFGINDVLRPGVPEAVAKCKHAGIKVVMVTGDNIDTANAIAKNCNIVTPEDEEQFKLTGKAYSMEGKTFYDRIGGMICEVCHEDCNVCKCPRTEAQVELIKLKKKDLNDPKWDEDIPIRSEKIKDMEAFKEIYESIRVIARSRPEDKYTLVFGLKELDFIVAVTGDGTNDAPALSKSDVGFAMGMAGTEIAKQAADIIILDDNFATIVMAVKWGRNIYDNIRKFVQFQLSVNVTACFIVFLCSCIGNETPLTAIQMLWVNLIMDSLGALALATEPPYEELLNRPPTSRNEYIINPLMWKHIIYQSLVQLVILLTVYLYGHRFIPETNPKHHIIAKQLVDCYGYIPGQQGLETVPDYNKIIAGPSLFWSVETQRLPDATPVSCGDFFHKINLLEAQHYFLSKYGSPHITAVFNIFVIYTLFNQINVRKIDDSYNTCLNLHLNWTFIILFFIEFGCQVIIIQVGGVAFRVSILGLDGPQWGICFAISFVTFLVNVILKPIPLQNCFIAVGDLMARMKKTKEDEEAKLEEEEEKEKGDQVIELKGGVQGQTSIKGNSNVNLYTGGNVGVSNANAGLTATVNVEANVGEAKLVSVSYFN